MTTTPVHILGISGSLRKGSFNTGLLHAAAELLPEQTTLEIFDLAPIPLYSQDTEADGLPESVQLFKQRIQAADALLIATPEYNYSFPGVLKNAIDWASRPYGQSAFDNKPVALLGAGGGLGTGRAQYQLRQVFVFLNMHTLSKPEVLVPMAWQKFDATGRLTDEATRDQIREQLVALANWTRRLRGE